MLVVGGGASGMLAALYAARAGARVTLLEKNEKLGKKVYITGKGRCNVTNLCATQEFLQNVPRNPRFLYAALALLPPEGMVSLLDALGCQTKLERGSRVFAQSDHASDVTRALQKGLESAGVRVCLNTQVKAIGARDGAFASVTLSSGETLEADACVLATGGMSYQSTGSTGDGWAFAEALGIQTKPPLAALVPLVIKEDVCARMQGLSLKNVTLSMRHRGKTLFCEQGELLMTHFGLSGPLALTCASLLPEAFDQAALEIDLKPALDEKQLDERLLRDIAQAGKKQFSSILPALLPSSMAAVFPDITGIPAQKPCSQLTNAERARLLRALKHFSLTCTGTRPLGEAIITRGGIDVKQVDASTMMTKAVRGLFVCGETLDVDAFTGGFNLQIAFSTGALAGQSAAAFSLSSR